MTTPENVDTTTITMPLDLAASLVEDSDCRYDHHAGCQEHGYLVLGPGEMCPQAELKALIAAEATQ